MTEAQRGPKRTATKRPASAIGTAAKPTAAVAYRVVKNVEHPVLQQTLDDMAADGWRLHTLLPALAGYLCVFER